MADWKIPKSSCPVCREVLDAATGLGHGNAPAPGAVTLCAGCGSALLLGEDLSLQVVPPDVWAEVIEDHPYLTRVREALLDLIQKGKAKGGGGEL